MTKVLMAILTLSTAILSAQPQQNQTPSNMKERIDIIKQDQISGTDTLAIPLDESEVEDEELIDEMEGVPFAPTVPTNNNSKTR